MHLKPAQRKNFIFIFIFHLILHQNHIHLNDTNLDLPFPLLPSLLNDLKPLPFLNAVQDVVEELFVVFLVLQLDLLWLQKRRHVVFKRKGKGKQFGAYQGEEECIWNRRDNLHGDCDLFDVYFDDAWLKSSHVVFINSFFLSLSWWSRKLDQDHKFHFCYIYSHVPCKHFGLDFVGKSWIIINCTLSIQKIKEFQNSNVKLNMDKYMAIKSVYQKFKVNFIFLYFCITNSN